MLPEPTTVEDTTDEVANKPYYRPESTFTFAGWQEGPLRALAPLLSPSPLPANAAPAADHSSEAVINSVLLHFELQY